MRLSIRATNLRLYEPAREEIERRVRFALSRFVGRIAQVTVGLSDVNGPKRGPDKQCRLVVRLLPAGRVTIDQRHADLVAAAALAADRAGSSVGREIKRRRDNRYVRRRSEAIGDARDHNDRPDAGDS